MPDPKEIATLLVHGSEFNDWETVWVQHNWTDIYQTFKFTCAERDIKPEAQIEPGEGCTIKLGGQLAVNGVVVTRQVAFEPKSHGVMLQGVSLQWWTGRASVFHPTGEFDNMSFEDIAKKVLEPTGTKAKPLGKLNAAPFVHCQIMPGEKIFDFLERLARDRKIIIAADRENNILFVGEGASVGDAGSIKEGVNLKSAQCVISVVTTHSEYEVGGQCWARDDKKYRHVSEQVAHAKGSAKHYSPLSTPLEQPVWTEQEVKTRCDMEQMWHEGQNVQVTAVVQGWLSQNGKLWTPGDDVSFESPMCMIKDKLKIQSVTYTQDVQSGTLTTLLLVAPWALNGPKTEFETTGGGALPPAQMGPATIRKG